MTDLDLTPVLEKLADAGRALEELDARCCEPGRSPRMARLGETLAKARTAVESIDGDSEGADAAIAHLEDAGSQIGWLQIGCCAPNRLPLYTRMLDDLTRAQLGINAALHRGH